ncbi:MAG TPA: DUF6152 family protein [Bryobacteraceae bacterium]|jgi:hypothetical protein
MKSAFATLIVLGALPLAALRLDAHHSFNAMYDEKKTIALQGTITKVEWMNPHARFWIDAKDADGKTTNWEVELGSPNGLIKGGYTRSVLQTGDSITVDGWPAKDNSKIAAAGTLTLASGQVLKSDPHWGPAEGMKK